jgi:hypothetical protein
MKKAGPGTDERRPGGQSRTEVLFQRMRDAGLIYAPLPREVSGQVPSQAVPRVQILIDDEVTIIKHGSPAGQAVSEFEREDPWYHFGDFLGYGEGRVYGDLWRSGHGYPGASGRGWWGYGDLQAYARGWVWGYGGDRGGPEGIGGDIVTIRVRSGGRVMVLTGYEAAQAAHWAIRRFNG